MRRTYKPIKKNRKTSNVPRFEHNIYKRCKSKVRYPTEHDAQQMIKKCKEHRDDDLYIYWCAVCNGYHLTRSDK